MSAPAMQQMKSWSSRILETPYSAGAWAVLSVMCAALACGGDDSRSGTSSPRGSSGGSGSASATSGNSTGSGAAGAQVSGQNVGQSGATSSGASSGVARSGQSSSGSPSAGDAFVAAPPVRSCDTEKCTADETCKPGPYGTYCLRPCKGQPCPSGTEPFCSRTGGLVCVDGS